MTRLKTLHYGISRTTVAKYPTTAKDKQRDAVAQAIADYANKKWFGAQTDGNHAHAATTETGTVAEQKWQKKGAAENTCDFIVSVAIFRIRISYTKKRAALCRGC